MARRWLRPTIAPSISRPLDRGSTVVARVHVGAWATVGAGAVALRDVEPDISVVGVPAARIRR
jgi:serine acetyltransferase